MKAYKDGNVIVCGPLRIVPICGFTCDYIAMDADDFASLTRMVDDTPMEALALLMQLETRMRRRIPQ